MVTFYVRIFLTYVPLLGVKGFLGLFFVVRWCPTGSRVWQRSEVRSGGCAAALGGGAVSGLGSGRWPGWRSCLTESENSGPCLPCFHSCAPPTRFLESNWFVWVTQMNHIPMHIDRDQNRDWVSTQVGGGLLEDIDVTQLRRGAGGAEMPGRGLWGNSHHGSSQQHCLTNWKLLLLPCGEGGDQGQPHSPSSQAALPTGAWPGLCVWCSEPRSPPPLSLQLQATCNVHKSAFNDWFSGHLNFQIEHQ